MRRRYASAARQARHQAPIVRQIQAPVGGLNARDALDDMAEDDAIQMDNWWPSFGKAEVRRGSSTFATLTGATGAVETLATLRTAGAEHLLAVCDGDFWVATPGGTIAASLGGSFANSRWQWAQMGALLGLVNGANTPQTFDGTSKAAMTISSGDVTVADLKGINVYKNRSYFWTGADQNFHFSAVLTLGGALNDFPLGGIGGLGGDLISMVTWTRDGGSGPDDFAVFIMSSGQAVVYQGSDPADAADWGIVGVYDIGEPISDRAIIKLGGDALIVTRDGYVLLSQVLGGERGRRGLGVSDKIVGAAQAAVRAGADSFGWQALHYPQGRMLIVNVPDGNGFKQHVANLATGAWCRFVGLEARCWTLFGGMPYFGGAAGKVIQADTGLTDDGVEVQATCRQAFSYLGSRAANKQITMIRPLLESASPIELTLGLTADFNTVATASVDVTLAVTASAGASWDTATWDVDSWGSSAAVVEAWLAHLARGYAISPSIRVEQDESAIAWNATTYAFTRAGVI